MIWLLPDGRHLDFEEHVHVMGILNTTPDSFYDGGEYLDPARGAERAIQMVEEGADLVDIGGESSRPPMYGAAVHVSAKEEIDRVIPTIQAIRRQIPVPISVDTTKADVAQAALDAGADIINDISATDADGDRMQRILSSGEVPVILMHRRGTAATMQQDTHYDDLLGEVSSYLSDRVNRVQEAGATAIATDPGVGFGKSVKDNYRLLRHAGAFAVGDCPVLIGASRKSFLWKPVGASPDQAMAASVAAAVMAAHYGARILRVHDVAQTVDALRVAAQIAADDQGDSAPSQGGDAPC